MIPKVLIVEKDSVRVQALEMMLHHNLGCESVAVQAIEQALAMLNSYRPDLVLAAIRQPEMNGIELCRRIKGNPDIAHIPVVLYSEYNIPQQHVEGLKAGAADVLAMPVHPVEFVVKVRALLKRDK